METTGYLSPDCLWSSVTSSVFGSKVQKLWWPFHSLHRFLHTFFFLSSFYLFFSYSFFFYNSNASCFRFVILTNITCIPCHVCTHSKGLKKVKIKNVCSVWCSSPSEVRPNLYFWLYTYYFSALHTVLQELWFAFSLNLTVHFLASPSVFITCSECFNL